MNKSKNILNRATKNKNISFLYLYKFFFVFLLLTFFSCASTQKKSSNKIDVENQIENQKTIQPDTKSDTKSENLNKQNINQQTDKSLEQQDTASPENSYINPSQKETETTNSELANQQLQSHHKKKTIKLLFAGDIMAHDENHWIKDYNKIWEGVKDLIEPADLAFANVESPIDSTQPVSSYPYFNMPVSYLNAAINAGFNVFSLCNNHSNDKSLNGIKETIKNTDLMAQEQADKQLYFSGLKNSKTDNFTYNFIEKNDWKILFLPVTEIINKPIYTEYINYSKPTKEDRAALIEYCKELRNKNTCDLFILSFHSAEPEYVRTYTKEQTAFYKELLSAGVDIIWANHAHIIKDRKIIIDTQKSTQKLIMYGNGNTISGQRRAPVLSQKNPNGERDNTGDGLLYEVVISKKDDENPTFDYIKPHFITTYITTAKGFILKKLDDDFVNYLYKVPRKDWAEYIKKRINIDEEYTKDLIEWQ